MTSAGNLLDQITTKKFIPPSIGVSSSVSKLAQQKADIDLVIKAFNIFLLQEISNNKNENAADALLAQPVANMKNTNLELKSNYQSVSVLVKANKKQTKSGDGGGYGPKDPPLEAPDWYKNSIKEADFTSYSTQQQSYTEDIAGLSVSNTWMTIGNAWVEGGSFEDVIKTLVADCIPCGLRIADLAELNPFQDILNELLNYLQSIYDQLMNYLKMLRSTDIYDALCYLLGFLNFMCISDLATILALLNFLLLDIINSIAALSIEGGLLALWGLLSPLFTPFFAGLQGILEQWVKMVLAPIDCIIDSILLQLDKLEDLGESMQSVSLPTQYKKVEMTYNDENNEKVYFYYPDTSKTNPINTLGEDLQAAIQKAKEPFQGVTNELRSGMSELLILILKGRDNILSEWNNIRDSLMEFLGLDLDCWSLSAELATMVKRIMRMIGLIKFVIDFMTEGFYCTPQSNFDSDSMKKAIEGYTNKILSPKSDLSDDDVKKSNVKNPSSVISVIEGQIVVTPYQENVLSEEGSVINQYQTMLSNPKSELWKSSTAISLDQCLKTNAEKFGKVHALMAEISKQAKEIFI